jgi:hypothetical protein
MIRTADAYRHGRRDGREVRIDNGALSDKVASAAS